MTMAVPREVTNSTPGWKKALAKLAPDIYLAVVFAAAFHFLVLLPLLTETLDFLNSGKIVLQNPVQFPKHLLIDAEKRRYLFGKKGAQQYHKGYGDHGDQGKGGMNHEQHHRYPNDHQQVADQIGNSVGYQYLDLPCVIDHAAHQFAGLPVMKKAHGKGLQLVINGEGQFSHKSPGRQMADGHTDKPADRPQQISRHQHHQENCDQLGRKASFRQGKGGSEPADDLWCDKVQQSRADKP